MEELGFSGLLANCSDKGRTGYNPIMMYAVVTYANMRGIRSVDRIVDLCERDLAFIWLTRGQKLKRDVFYDFKNRKLTSDVLDDLNYQLIGNYNYMPDDSISLCGAICQKYLAGQIDRAEFASEIEDYWKNTAPVEH